MTGAALIAQIRDFHKDCNGCPVEQMCDEYEAVLGDRAVLFTKKQSDEMLEYLTDIATSDVVFSKEHDLYDRAWVYIGWLPKSDSNTGSSPK